MPSVSRYPNGSDGISIMMSFGGENLTSRRIETLMAAGMPDGYKFLPDPDAVAAAVLKNSTWAVLALILEIELFTQEHYKQSIEPEDNLLTNSKSYPLF